MMLVDPAPRRRLRLWGHAVATQAMASVAGTTALQIYKPPILIAWMESLTVTGISTETFGQLTNGPKAFAKNRNKETLIIVYISI